MSADDEVALIPPVSGGAGRCARARHREPLDVAALPAAVRDPRAGAVVVFEGVTREVPELDYEAYAEMALEQAARDRRRGGRSATGCAPSRSSTASAPCRCREPSVIVAASAPHRGEAFAGARALIDRVKAEAPIWKVEVDGADRRRVEGTLPRLPLRDDGRTSPSAKRRRRSA